MLSPQQLKEIPESFVRGLQALEDYIIADIARRIGEDGGLTETGVYNIKKALSLGADLREIEEMIHNVTDAQIKDIDRVVREALGESMEIDNAIYKSAGYDPVDFQKSPQLMDLLEEGIRQTQGELKNLTASLGFASNIGGEIVFQNVASFYHSTLDMAAMQVSTGVLDLNSAKRHAVKKMADSGIRYVEYGTGHVNRVDVAVRRAIITGINQLNLRLTDAIMDELGAEFVEVTAHPGARPSHAVWQGKVYHVGGAKEGYPDLESSTGYGTGPGLGGWNCRHSYFPFFPGISTRAYTDGQLDSIDNPPFIYNDKRYTHYEALQRQRKMETDMRRTKRELIAYDAAGLKDDFTAASIRLNLQKNAYKAFSSAANLSTQLIRAEQYGFSKSISQKAVWAAKPARRKKNLPPLEDLSVPLQKREVKKIARRYGFSLDGLTIKIQRDVGLVNVPIAGATDYDNIGRIDIFPNAFKSEEELIQTLIHENCHVMQLRKYGKEYTQKNIAKMEQIAERYEGLWYNYLKRRL